MKKHFSHKDKNQIWRILISESDKLILEIRDTQSKENYFHCFDLTNGDEIFTNLQLEEKLWLGMEAVYKDIIYFHKFPKPDMPWHKEIIAYDIASQKILWTNKELTFLFAYKNIIYGFKQGFEERYFFLLDFMNGGVIEEIGNDFNRINRLQAQAENEKKWEVYIYPKTFNNDNVESGLDKIINKHTDGLNITGEIEYNVSGNLVLFNCNINISGNRFENKFTAVDIHSGKVVLSEILNSNTSALFTDSFFVYKNYLFLLREKNEVIIYKLE